MNWLEVLTIMGAIFMANMGVMIPMFLWLRSESRNEIREFRKEMNEGFQKVDQRFEKVDHRFDKLEERLSHMDRRVSFFEGTVYQEEKNRERNK